MEQTASRERTASISNVGNPVGIQFELFVELQKSLYQAENLLSEVNLSRFGLEVFSNFWIGGKCLSVEPKMAFRELQIAIGNPTCGDILTFARTYFARAERVVALD